MTWTSYRSSVTFGADTLALRWIGGDDSLAQMKRDLQGLFI
ncbi:hypothetical protein [Ruegeria hyattellae]